jgi:hypothetical protein
VVCLTVVVVKGGVVEVTVTVEQEADISESAIKPVQTRARQLFLLGSQFFIYSPLMGYAGRFLSLLTG